MSVAEFIALFHLTVLLYEQKNKGRVRNSAPGKSGGMLFLFQIVCLANDVGRILGCYKDYRSKEQAGVWCQCFLQNDCAFDGRFTALTGLKVSRYGAAVGVFNRRAF